MKTINSNKDKMIELVIALCYKSAIIVTYKLSISEYYNYLGYTYNFNIGKYIGASLLIYLLVMLSWRIRKVYLRFSFDILNYMSAIPMLILFSFKQYEWKYFFIVALYWIVLCSSFVFFSNIINSKGNKMFEFSKIDIIYKLVLAVGFSAAIYLYLHFSQGLFSSILNTYDARRYFRDSSSSIEVYLINWTGTIFLPLSFIFYALYNKKFYCMLCLLGAVLIFFSNGQKAWLFFYPALIAILLFSKGDNYKRTSHAMGWGSIGFLLSSLLVYKKTNITTLGNLVTRIYIGLAEITYQYIDFFQNNPLLYLRESVLRHFFESPYPKNTSSIIADIYWSAADYKNSTSGLLGDAYANFGIIGVLVYPVILTMCFFYLENISNSYPMRMGLCIVFVFTYQAQNLPMLTWLLTGGVLIFAFLNSILAFAQKRNLRILN